MSRFNKHKRVLLRLLSAYCPSAYYLLCPPDAGFPRVAYELKQLNVEGYPYEKYILTLDCYDKGQMEDADAFIDDLITHVDGSVLYTDDFYYQFYYQKDRQPIAEADKNLKRIRLTFEVRIYVRSDNECPQ